MARKERQMEFDWASYGLGIVTGVVGVAAALAGLGFWAWATNKRGLDAQDIDNQMEEAKYDEAFPARIPVPASPLPAVPDNLTSSLTNRSAPVPQLGYVDHHRTRRRRTG
jgi:hypothetical protein